MSNRGAVSGLCVLMLSVAMTARTSAQSGPPTMGIPNDSPITPVTGPIQVQACVTGQNGGYLVAETNRNFRVTFTNEGTVEADLIQFEIKLGEERLLIRDVGKFAPGVTISHLFKRRGGNVVSSPLFAPARFQCSVAAVHFSDGSVWSPQTSDPRNAQIRATQTTQVDRLGLVLEQRNAQIAVRLVLPGVPADIAGIKQNDILSTIANQRVATIADALILISATPANAKLVLVVLRGGLEETVPIIVGSKNL